MKLCKGNILRNKSDPYYIELSNNYSLLVETSANPSLTYTPTSTDSQFKIKSANRLQKNKNEKLNKYMCTNTNNDNKLIDAATTIAEDERTDRSKKDFTNAHSHI